MFLTHLIDFLVDYFTNLTFKKIVGGVLILIGTYITSRLSGSIDQMILTTATGLLVSGIGFVIIYHDMHSDKKDTKINELEALKIAHDYKNHKADQKISTWNDQSISSDSDLVEKDADLSALDNKK